MVNLWQTGFFCRGQSYKFAASITASKTDPKIVPVYTLLFCSAKKTTPSLIFIICCWNVCQLFSMLGPSAKSRAQNWNFLSLKDYPWYCAQWVWGDLLLTQWSKIKSVGDIIFYNFGTLDLALIPRPSFSGWAYHWHGSWCKAFALELYLGHDPRGAVSGPDVTLHGGVRGAVHKVGHHGQWKVPVSRIHTGDTDMLTQNYKLGIQWGSVVCSLNGSIFKPWLE